MGERSIQEKYQAWRKCPGMNEELLNQLKAMSPDELNDSFYRSLAFGTGGLRGVLGAGENRMNLYTCLLYTSTPCPRRRAGWDVTCWRRARSRPALSAATAASIAAILPS